MSAGRAQTTGRRARGSAQIQIRLSAAELAALDSAIDAARGDESRPAFATRALLAALAASVAPLKKQRTP